MEPLQIQGVLKPVGFPCVGKGVGNPKTQGQLSLKGGKISLAMIKDKG